MDINLQPTLQDELVVLKPLQPEDFEKLFAVASDPLIWEQHPVKDRYKPEVFKIFFDGAVASKGAFLVCEKTTGELMGSTRYYDFKPELSQIAIGFTFIARKYWGGKYNFSMKKLMMDYAFRYVDTVLYHIGASNIRSQKAQLKLGGKKIKEIDLDLNGQKLLHYEYEIRKADWNKLLVALVQNSVSK
jgi:RimJ/RimL family protein N-acetyltransferase